MTLLRMSLLAARLALVPLFGAMAAAAPAADDTDASPASKVDIFLPMMTDGWMASVVSVAPSATTYSLGCAPLATQTKSLGYSAPAALTECGTITVVQGPQTWSMHWDVPDVLTNDMSCDPFDLGTTAVCTGTETRVDSDKSMTAARTTTITESEGALPTGPITVTAGLDKLNKDKDKDKGKDGDGKKVSKDNGQESTATGTVATATATDTGTGTGTGTETGGPTSTETGAAARSTGWIAAGGAAAMVAVAAAV